MPQVYNVRLYYNTGFNSGNIPGDASVLTGFTYKDFDGVFRFQDRNNATIRIKSEWNDVKNADYLRLGGDSPTYYVINGVSMLSGLTAELSLTMDPLMTAGGLSAITITGGWAKRAHTDNDTLFGNITPEPWAPSSRLIIRDKKTIHKMPRGETQNIVIATCNVGSLEEFKAKLAQVSDEAQSGSVVFPLLPSMGLYAGTIVFMPKEADSETALPQYRLPGMYAFDMSAESVKAGLNAARSIGVESAIVAMYTVPKQDVMAEAENVPGFESFLPYLYGQEHLYNSEMPYLYKSVKNKKAVSLYSTYQVLSTSSGASETYEAHDLYAGGDAPDFRTKADPSPDGTVYCQPTYYEGAATVRLEQAVAGSPWYNAGFVYNSASGSAIMSMNAARARNMDLTTTVQNLDMQGLNAQKAYIQGTATLIDSYTGLVTSGIGAVSAAQNVMGPNAATPRASDLTNAGMSVGRSGFLGNLLGAYTARDLDALNSQALEAQYNNTATNYMMRLGDNLFTTGVAANLAAPQPAFPITATAASYYGNAFQLVHITLSDNDLARFDKFLTAYGYACDKPLEKSDLTNRAMFNYILASDANVKSDIAPASLCQEIANVLAAGIRIWHVAPSAGAFDDNPIKEG